MGETSFFLLIMHARAQTSSNPAERSTANKSHEKELSFDAPDGKVASLSIEIDSGASGGGVVGCCITNSSVIGAAEVAFG